MFQLLRTATLLAAAAAAVAACSTKSGNSGTPTLTCTQPGQKAGSCPNDKPTAQIDYQACVACLSQQQAVVNCLVGQGYVYQLGCDADGETNVVNKPTDAQTKACQAQGAAYDACDLAFDGGTGGTEDGGGTDSGGGNDDGGGTDSGAE
jgi:hypothetical protein